MPRRSARTGATESGPDGLRRRFADGSSDAIVLGLLRLVHRDVGKPVGMSVQLASDVLVGDLANLVGEKAGLGVQCLQAWMLHLVAPPHLLDEQQRIGSNVHGLEAVLASPLERR